MTRNDELSLALERKISHLQAIALTQILGRLDRARTLEELTSAIRDYTRTMDNAIIKACDKAVEERRQLEAPKETAPQMLAILKDRDGAEMDRLTLKDSDPLDCDHFAQQFAESWGFELDVDGIVPDGTEDYSVTLTDDPAGVRCWSSANYMMTQK